MFKLNICSNPTCKHNAVSLIKDGIILDEPGYCIDHSLSKEETEQAILEEVAVDAPSVIISRRPCALLKYVKAKPALKIDKEKCRTCKMCMKIGCPAISIKDGKAVIDATLCTGCGLCEQMCPFGAISGGEE